MLRTGVQSQLEGIRTAIAHLQTAAEDIAAVDTGFVIISLHIRLIQINFHMRTVDSHLSLVSILFRPITMLLYCISLNVWFAAPWIIVGNEYPMERREGRLSMKWYVMFRITSIGQRLKPFPELKERMRELRDANARHGQYAAAMENLKHIFNINQTIEVAIYKIYFCTVSAKNRIQLFWKSYI